MDRLKRLLSFQGRASRLEFWRWYLLSSVIGAGLFILSISIALTEAPGSKILAGVLLAGVPLLLWPALAVAVRRLHDRNRPAWLAVIFCGVPIVANLVAADSEGQGVGVVALLFMLAALVIIVWSWVELGFLRGTRGANRFGPEPLPAPRGRRAVAA